MKVYRHQPKGVRFCVLLLFTVVLLILNGMILPGKEELPVKIFTLLFTLAWLVVAIDSLLAKVVVDDRGIGVFSVLLKKFAGWSDITEVNFGQRWVMGTFMPEHINIVFQAGPGGRTGTMTIHNDIKNWEGLLKDIVLYAPPRVVPAVVKARR